MILAVNMLKNNVFTILAAMDGKVLGERKEKQCPESRMKEH